MAKVVKKPDETSLVVDSFGGLDLLPDVLSRPYNSWRRAENVDLYTPGSMRKVIGPQLLRTFPTPILEMINYLRSADDNLRQLGVGVNGHFYWLDDGTDLGLIATVNEPWMGVFGGTSNNTSIQYVVLTVDNNFPVKWEPVTGVSDLGVEPAGAAVVVTPTFSASSANAYLMQAGIQYMWTYFNPDSLHESSPSPIESTAIITPTTNAPPASTPYTTQVKLDITTPDPSPGTGYTRIKIYRTRDGGSTFYLLPHVYNAGGVDQVDGDLSVLRSTPTTTFYDGVAASNIAPIPDQLLVNPPQGGPAFGDNDPPPKAIWGTTYQNRMWLLARDGRRLHFSQLGDFQSYGVFDYMDFTKEQNDVVMGMIPLSDRMVVTSRNSARQITGTDFSDFVEVPIDMRRGIVGRRAATTDGDTIYGLTAQSISRMSFAAAGPPFVGDKVKPITDTIQAAARQYVICMDIDTVNAMMVFAIRINGVTYNDQILVADLSRESPFTKIVGLPTDVVCLRELESTSAVKGMYFTGANGGFYLLRGGNGTLTATLETQALPLTDYNIWRMFKELQITGTDLANWTVAASVDGRAFSSPQPIGIPSGSLTAKIGQSGSQVVLQFVHNVNNGVAALLSRMKLTYEDKMGKA